MVQGGLTERVLVCLAALLLCASAALASARPVSASVYFGATISGETYGQTGSAPTNLEAWELFERHAGKRVAILNQGQPWGEFDSDEVEATAARGAIPLVTMGLKEGVTLESIADGAQDATIKKWAQEAKAFGHPFFFAPWWEMNGAWYPWGRSPDFIAAWRHFHDLVVAQGASNVTWTWLVNSVWSDPESTPAPYYPGDAYVDWTGLDSYNWGENPAQPDRWITPNQTFNPTLKIIREVAPTKPVAIVEDASTEYGGNKADWIREVLTTYLPHHPEVQAYLWFNWNFAKNGTRSDWPIESSAPAQQQFRESVQSSFFVPGPVSLPTLQKVAPPSPGAADPAQPTDISAPAEVPTAPDVAVAPDGTSTIVWKRYDGSHYLVEERRLTPTGERLPAEATNVLSETGGDAVEPAVAAGPDGTATVVWSRCDGAHSIVQERRIDESGAPEAMTTDLSAAGENAIEPQVAVAPGGAATAVWTRFDGSHWVIQKRRLSAAGAAEGTPANLSSTSHDATEPQLAVGTDGKVTVVWDRDDGSNWIVQARRIDASGASAAATLSLSASGRDAGEPEVDVAPAGTATVLWSRFDGSNWIVQRRDVATDEALSATTNLSAAGRRGSGPVVAWGSGGDLTMAWRRFAGSGDAVEATPLPTPLPPPPPVEEGGGAGGAGGGGPAPTPSGATTTAGAGVAGPGPAAPGSTAASASMRLVKVIVNRRRGTARLLVEVSGPGRLALKGAAPRDRAVGAAGTVALKVVPRLAQRQLLARQGRLPLKLTVSFRPLTGKALSRSLTVRLKTSG